MRIYMQQPAAEGVALRFFHLSLQKDLLGGWSLVRESGYQGSAGRVIKKHFADRQEALAAMIKLRDLQLNKGYRVVFAQGDSLPSG